jgi:hypothetical protein
MDAIEPKEVIKKVSPHYDDRFTYYQESQRRMSPSRFARSTRLLWIIGAVLNIIATVLMTLAFKTTLDENASSSLNMVRVDGVKVEESFDMRRDVLINNTKNRMSIQNDIIKSKGGAE